MGDGRMTWDSKLIEDFCTKMSDNAIVPVIGNNAFYYQDGDEQPSLQYYIAKRLLEAVDGEIGKNGYLLKTASKGNKGMTLLDHKLREKGADLKNEICKILSNPDFKKSVRLRPSVENFLKFSNTPLIITVSAFDFIDELLPISFAKKVVYYCEKNNRQDITLKDTSDAEIDNDTVFYLFGKISRYTDSVITENDFLRYLHCLHDTNKRPDKLMEYLKNRFVFMIGCDLPDWTFRFLLYSLKSDSVLTKNGKREDFNGGYLNNEIDVDLSSFLSEICYMSDIDIDNFLRMVTPIDTTSSKPSIFLSYSAEKGSDIYERIISIKKKLEKFFAVWFFPERDASLPAAQYWDKIIAALHNCRYFIPIVSQKMVNRLYRECIDRGGTIDENPIPDGEPGFITEWKYAVQCAKKYSEKHLIYSIPLLLDVNADDISDLKNKMPSLEVLFYPDGGVNMIDERVNVEVLYNNLK